MKKSGLNSQFISEVVDALLQVPNLKEEVNPLLTKRLKDKFLKAGERVKEILASFNSLPGVKAELYTENEDPNRLFELDIPTHSYFLTRKDNCEVAVLDVGLKKSVVDYYTSCQSGNRNDSDVSEIYKNWEEKYFKKQKFANYYMESEMTIPELYIAVQELIESYLKILDK